MSAPRVLLIGWDAADWKVIHPLIAAGRMPNLQRLIENGASGKIATLHPPLSPMLWTSIATGKRPFRHGIHGFSEPTANGRGVRPVTNLSRKCKALWNILNQNDLRSIVVGWWPSHPAEPIDGVMVSDQYARIGGPLEGGWPLQPDAIHPLNLAETLAALRVHPEALEAQMVERFIPLAREIDQDGDKRLGALMRMLAECMSVQAAADWLIEHHRWDFFAVYFDSIDHFCHGFMRYHPPRQPWIDERDFELYHQVVGKAYELQDAMLGMLLGKAGKDVTTILISDHGFHPDHLRHSSIPDIPAGPAIEHRDFGIIVVNGSSVRSGAPIHGASVLDVTPTILSLYGLPVGADMDGKVLSQAFVKPSRIRFVASWEEVPGADGRHPPHTLLDPMGAHEALEQMIALGYIERPDRDHRVAVQRTIRELRYNAACAYQDAGRHVEAHRIFTELRSACPDEQRFAVGLFVSCQALRMHHEMRSIVADLKGRERCDPTVTDYLSALVLAAEKRYGEALDKLEKLARAQPDRPELLIPIATLNLRLRRQDRASEIYRQALALDPDNAQAQMALCRLALHRRDFALAANLALDALQGLFQEPMAHFLLGRALSGLKQYERAVDAFRAAISINPNFPEAHMRLAALLETQTGDPESARKHRLLARRMRRRSGLRGEGREPRAPRRIAATVHPNGAVAVKESPLSAFADSIVVVSGLPRSGTSMVMQMLAAGGMRVLSDESRQADEDNPRGYLEFAPVRNLFADSSWLMRQRGTAVKIVTPLLAALPQGLACRVILCERDLDDVLDSQERMLRRRGTSHSNRPERRSVLKEEYARAVTHARQMLSQRPHTRVLTVQYESAVSDPQACAERINEFLSARLDVTRMVSAVEPALHRNHSASSSLILTSPPLSPESSSAATRTSPAEPNAPA